MAQIKKLSVKTVYGLIDLEKLINAPGKKLDVMTVLGLAVAVKQGTATYGDWTALQGQFEATNCETGEVFSSATLFLPEVALVPIQIALAQEGSRGVEFAIKIGVEYNPNKKPGGSAYSYTFDPLIPPDNNDPVSRLKSKLLALAAPAGTAAPAPAPAVPAKSAKK